MLSSHPVTKMPIFNVTHVHQPLSELPYSFNEIVKPRDSVY